MEFEEAKPGALALISGYGEGGFRIGGVRHDGHLLICPEGPFPWPVEDLSAPLKKSLNALFSKEIHVEFLLVGVGREAPDTTLLARRLSAELKLPVEVMTTGAAVRTYNVLALEGRRVGAALWAV
jgi:uncharacterized protein